MRTAVTFLLTDIEGSSQVWEQAPDAMTDALLRLDALLTDAVDTFQITKAAVRSG